MTAVELNSLRRYGQHYCRRYAPSKQRLIEKLLARCDQQQSLVDQVLPDLLGLINEAETIADHINRYQSKGKIAGTCNTTYSGEAFLRMILRQVWLVR